MKKTIAFLLVACMCLGFAACGGSAAPAATEATQKASAETAAAAAPAQSVTLNVVTSYGGDDGNRKNF